LEVIREIAAVRVASEQFTITKACSKKLYKGRGSAITFLTGTRAPNMFAVISNTLKQINIFGKLLSNIAKHFVVKVFIVLQSGNNKDHLPS